MQIPKQKSRVAASPFNDDQRELDQFVKEEHNRDPDDVNKEAGAVVAHGYAYDRQDQRVAWTREFASEADATEWARRRNATVLSIVPKPVNENNPAAAWPEFGATKTYESQLAEAKQRLAEDDLSEVTGDLPFDTMLSKIVAGGNLQTLAAKIVAKIKKFPQHVESDGYERDMPRYPDGHFYGADVLNDTFDEVMQQWKKMGPDNFSDEYGEESLFDVLDGSADYTRYWDGILKLRNRLQSMPGALEQLGKMVWHGLFSGNVEQGITDIGRKGVAEGAKVDRMVKHIASSEKSDGKSKKDAENIAWATVNKRGMLDNKNKKKISEAERNEMDTPAVQAALKKMSDRHKDEKWSKEQLAALGKRLAAQDKKPVKETKISADIRAKNRAVVKKLQGTEVKEDITQEDIITKLKAKLGDYLSDLGQQIKKDPALQDKLSAETPGDQVGPAVKTVTTDDGQTISIHGNEDDGFRISIKNKHTPSRFDSLDEAVMACEMYRAHRRRQALNADYVDEA
jgi:hypothetical protein